MNIQLVWDNEITDIDEDCSEITYNKVLLSSSTTVNKSSQLTKNKGQVKEADKESIIDEINVKLLRRRDSYKSFQIDRKTLDQILNISFDKDDSSNSEKANLFNCE